MGKKGLVFRLAALLPILVTCVIVLSSLAFAQAVPLTIIGYVTVNGTPMAGVTVSGGGQSTTTASDGSYTLGIGIATNTSATITATYQGYSASGTATQENQGMVELDLSIVTPVANFTANATSGVVPLTVMFNDTSSGYPSAWNWSFGDNTANVTAQNVTHTFSSGGKYNVVLTIGSGTQISSVCRQITV